MLKKVLFYYGKDFSSCVKELIAEKLEDLVDIGSVRKIKEGAQEDYYTAREIEAAFKKKKN